GEPGDSRGLGAQHAVRGVDDVHRHRDAHGVAGRRGVAQHDPVAELGAGAGSRHANAARSRATGATLAIDVFPCRSVPVHRGTARERTTVALTVPPWTALAGRVRKTTWLGRADADAAAR